MANDHKEGQGFRFKVALFVASGFGAGFVPKAPGTAGAAAALPLCWFITTLSWPAQAVAVALVTALAVASAHVVEKGLGIKDPSVVTIDEVAGMAAAFAFHTFTLTSALSLFALFRLFDIWKPFPVKQLEERLSGGFGIVMDDVAAGIWANLIWTVLAEVHWHV
jgi:phosphatidylglycerophosphatase A